MLKVPPMLTSPPQSAPLPTYLQLTRLVPPGFARWLGGVLGWWFAVLPLREQMRCRRHLRRAFPWKSEAWIERTTRGCFRHFGRMALWSIATVTHSPRTLMRPIVVEGAEHLRECNRASRRGQGTVLFTGHFGNWELACRVGSKVVPATLIGKRLRQQLLDRLVVGVRTSFGAQQLYQDQDIRHSIRALRSGRVICTLVDQDIARLPGIHVPWFGIPAYTATAPAALAMLGGGMVQLVFCYERRGRWVLHFSPRRHFPRSADRKADLHAITRWVTAYEEGLVRLNPQQWVWWHQRWRTLEPLVPPPYTQETISLASMLATEPVEEVSGLSLRSGLGGRTTSATDRYVESER